MDPIETEKSNQPRNIRQAEIIPESELRQVAAVVIGCGAIGSWLAKFLAHMGVPYMLLIDPDKVSPENLALQGYSVDNLDEFKVFALALQLTAIHDQLVVEPVADKFRGDLLNKVPDDLARLVVFSCVDNIASRSRIYEAVRRRCQLFVDGRMAGLVYRVITIDDLSDGYYKSTLFSPEEANVLRCTAKGMVCTAAEPASKMATQLVLWLKGAITEDGTLCRDMEGNLLTMTLERRDDVPVGGT